MKIKGCELGDNVVTEIGKFTILWAEFEKRFCDNNCNSNAIWKFANSYIVDDNELKEFSQQIHGRIEFYKIDDVDYYVQHKLIPDKAHDIPEADKKAIKDFMALQGGNVLAGAMLAIYRIRNNLLHGLKIISELKDQLKLFKSMNAILKSILEF